MPVTDSMNVSDLFSIKGKVALVTGGARGVGFMIARGFVENGARVYLTARKADQCAAAAEELSKMGECLAVPADLSTNEGRAKLIAEIGGREPGLNLLVNNAGASWGAAFDEYPESGYDKVMDINLKAIFLLTQSLLPLLEKGGSMEDPARIINIGSIDGIWVPKLDNFAYSASKAAVHHLTEVLAVKLAGRGITVNAIAPGFFPTQMTKWVLENFQEEYEQKCPRHRIGEPSDLAGAAIFLSSRAGAYVNGAVIVVDGGLHLT
jgi:NAD(P)-dependent dehydrogenase (short-subunit alcohol dehydrogenase family)